MSLAVRMGDPEYRLIVPGINGPLQHDTVDGEPHGAERESCACRGDAKSRELSRHAGREVECVEEGDQASDRDGVGRKEGHVVCRPSHAAGVFGEHRSMIVERPIRVEGAAMGNAKKPTTVSVADSTSILGSTGRSGSEVTPVERTTLVLDISPPFETRLGRPLFRSHGMRFAVGTAQCLAPIGDKSARTSGADPATWPLHPWT
jgi:hypothetical protein